MFQRFKSRFTRTPFLSQAIPEHVPEIVRDKGGYFRPQSAETLLATSERDQYLRQLWENSALPAGLYQQFYLALLRQLCARVQHVPAVQEGVWSYRSGFIDLTLQFTACAVRLAKGHMLPPGVAPETQATQSLLWQAVVFWSALFYHLPLLQQLEGELEDGHHWQPGLWIPERRFRFRFQTSRCESPISYKTLLAARLLPEEAVTWLSLVPGAWQCLMLHLGGHPSSVPLTDSLLQSAAEQVQSPLLNPVDSAETRAAAVQSPTESEPVIPAATPGTAFVPDVAEDTRTLLSLFQIQTENSDKK
ncbi:integrating conjugative element relaxase (TIGR03760 family) [Xenorhabdus cabanillasii]|uniref:Integrating conjugative element relaxase (TIGR03760 family) n=1 Tax=Xenorhabdus cabanillasii TaxID=351673 RepID=A0A3D9UEU5_9GAMM|nr:TraI domain-containing protein [Xenorhabdus cabanillasii]REF26420.1 integrating conjugative element relaxase (TIGR03760 family) [Xenorhabdus cabanillasii]